MLSLQDSLRSSTHKGVPGWLMRPWETLLPWNSKEMKCCLYETPYITAPIRVLGDVIVNSTPYTRLPTDAPTRASFFLVHECCFFVRDPSCHMETSRWNFYKKIYEQRWYWKQTTYHISWGVPQRVPQASLQADSTLTCHHEKEPQEPRRTRWLQEKGRWAISPDSHMSHPLHF